MSGQVSRGSAGDYKADERASGVPERYIPASEECGKEEMILPEFPANVFCSSCSYEPLNIDLFLVTTVIDGHFSVC